MSKRKRQQQTEIPGTEPVRNAEIEQALDAWLAAKDEQKSAGETTRLRHFSLLQRLGEAGLENYPYVDPSTGKKKLVVVARDPKAKMIAAPRESKQRRDRGEVDEPGEEVTAPVDKTADQVEHRKVSRKSVEADIDPFAATRAAMESP